MTFQIASFSAKSDDESSKKGKFIDALSIGSGEFSRDCLDPSS